MRTTRAKLALAMLTTVATTTAPLGCREGRDGDDHGPPPAAPAATPAAAAAKVDPDRLAVPESVRSNLGITFARVERRRVASTVRLPGHFELLPSARREYVTPLPARVELLVRQYQQVEPGTPLYRLESPEWLRLRQQLVEEQAAARKAEAGVAVAQASLAEARKAADLLAGRVDALAGAEVRRAELDAQLAEKRASLPRLEAEVAAAVAEHEAARQRFPLTLATAAALTGLSVADLSAEVPTPGGGPLPRWRTIESIEVRAAAAGVVESLAVTSGSWVEGHKPVLTTVDRKALRFRAVGLQADLGRLRDGLPATIVPPRGSGIDPAAAPPRIPGTLAVGLDANPQQRTIELIVEPDRAALDGWARAGVSALLEVALDATAEPEPAIPVAAVIQDELKRIYFRRDPKDPNVVIRTEADLGVSDGQWVVVHSGVRAGDEVVVEGVFELKLAHAARASGSSPGAKGHFHADGTYHEGKD